MNTPTRFYTALSLALLGPALPVRDRAHADEKAPAAWVKHDKAVMGPTRPAALVYAPTVQRWMTLGYLFPPGNGRQKPMSYDELAFDPAEGQWENFYPPGKDWGPKFGDANAPPWKGQGNRFKDAEGNVRPNWEAWYWLYGTGRNCAWDADGKRFIFYIDGSTFSYDPAARAWKELAPKGDPQTTLHSKTLLWGSLCYDEANKNVVLFGGGNAETERGDPGTWTYTPATNTWTQLKLAVQPPARANSALVYDPANKKVVLFGGDQLNQLIADTWVFDGAKWEQKKPGVSPSPRAGHAMLWLPTAKKVLLLGGYGYASDTGYTPGLYRSLPMEAWTYDVAANRWDLIQRTEPAKKPAAASGPVSPPKNFLLAAVDSEDQVAVVDANREFWTWHVGVAADDAALTDKHGVKPGAVERRTGPYDPAWYADGVAAADPAKVEADLTALPANQWNLRPTPKLPRPNTDWGSAVYAVDCDKIVRYSGGHSAYGGTAPHVYDIKTDRWSLPFAPEMPIDFTYGNDGTPGEWSFGGNPWMTGHTYKATGYDPNLKCLVFGPHKYSYFFDPLAGKWSRGSQPNPYRCSFYTVTLIPTPKGLVAWTVGDPGKLFWRLNADDKTWTPLPVKGKFPVPVCDNAGMAYDSKRNRMIAFAAEGKAGSTAHEYDLATGETKAIDAAGHDKVQTVVRAAHGDNGHFEFREAVYLPDLDMVMIGATGLFYDCAKTAWFHAVLPSDKPNLCKHPSYNLGVMADTKRKLVWAVDTNSLVYALRLDLPTLKLEAVR